MGPDQLAMRRLGEICEITAGPSGALLSALHEGTEGVPVITPRNLTELRSVDHRDLRRVPVADAEKLKRFTLRAGDLVMVRQGSLGRVAVISGSESDWLFNSSCLRLRLQSEEVLCRYLAVYLSYSNAWTEFISQPLASTVPLLTSEMLGRFQVALPPVEHQLKVVDLFSSIDARIEVERAIIERLEAVRLSLLDEIVKGDAPWSA